MYFISTSPAKTGRVNGENQVRLKPLPKTLLKLFHDRRRETIDSFFKCSIPVSSFQMACICTPNMIRVKMANNNASNITQTSKIMVHGVGVLRSDAPQMEGHSM